VVNETAGSGNGIHRAGGFSVTWVDEAGQTHNDEARPAASGVMSWIVPSDCAEVVEVITTRGASAAASPGAVSVVTPGGPLCPTCGQPR
jgi:hypothetical protein